MRGLIGFFLLSVVFCFVTGCGRRSFDGPTIDSFTGKVTSNGKPVTFPAGEFISIHLFHEKGQSFEIPVQSDGTWKIGWMPIGKYSVMVNLPSKGQKGPPPKANVPGGLHIEAGKTEYTIELGSAWKP